MASCRKEAEVETQPGTQSQWATCKAVVFAIFHVSFTYLHFASLPFFKILEVSTNLL